MKKIIFFAVLGLLTLVFLLGITGVYSLWFGSSSARTEGEDVPEKMTTGRITFALFHPKIENKKIFHGTVSSAAELPLTEDDKETGVVKRYLLDDVLLTPEVVSPDDPAVRIEAGRADLFQHARMKGKDEIPYFRSHLRDGVNVEASQRTKLVVSSDEMFYWQDLRAIRADGPVTIRDADSRLLHLTGEEMDGMLDFRNLIVHKSPVAYIVGGAFEREASTHNASEPRNVTRITCRGPVTVRRFERPHYIKAFLAELETLVSFGPARDEVVQLLAALQKRMLEEGVKHEDHAGILKLAGEAIEELSVPHGTRLIEQDDGGTLLRAISYLRYVSPDLNLKDLRLLQELKRKLDEKDLDLGTNVSTASMTIITFETDVVTATRAAVPELASDLAALADKQDIADDFSPPFVDSVQRCERMVIYCREEAGAGRESAAGMEPIKIELHGGERPVVMESYEPRNARRKKLAMFQSAKDAAVYTERRTRVDSSGKERAKLVQKRLVLDGDVYVRRFERQEKPKGELIAAIEARGNRLEWSRNTGEGRLSGTPEERPTLEYSSAPAMAPFSSSNGRPASAFTVDASAARSITLFQPRGEGPTRVRLLEDVEIKRYQITSDGKKQRDLLKAADWTDLTFRRSVLQSSEADQGIFSSLESVRALGNVYLNSSNGEAWGDYLVHGKGKENGRDVEITALYKIDEQNREELLGDEPFVTRNWPLRAVMAGRSGADFLGTLREERGGTGGFQTYTTVCDGEIRYIHFPEDARSAGKAIFLKNVRIRRTESGSPTATTLEAAERVELDFIRVAASGEESDKTATAPSKLYAQGKVRLSEPVEKGGTSKRQEALADTLTWVRLDAAAAPGGKAADRVALEGTGTIAPEVRYTVTQKVDVKRNGRVVDTATEEEQTVITCSPDGGRITVFRLQDPAQCEKPEDNYILAEKEAHVHRTGATINSAGGREADAPWDVRAKKITTYYIPATEKGMRARVKKIIADGGVVAGSSRMTATGDRGVWERIYRADIVEHTTLYAGPGGAARIRLLSKDRRGRPVDTKMRCADRIIFTRTIYDELVSPKVAATAKAVLINTVRVDHLGHIDKSEKLNQDITLTCDRLDIEFSDILRQKGRGIEDSRLDIERMIAAGDAKYQVFELLKKDHKYPDHLVLTSEGRGGYIEYNKPGSGSALGRMRGKKNERGEYIEEAFRTVYQYDKDTRKRLGRGSTEHGNVLPPLLGLE